MVKDKKPWIIALLAAAAAVAIGVSIWSGGPGKDKKDQSGTADAPSAVEEIPKPTMLPGIGASELSLLSPLYNSMEERDLEGAARILNDNEEAFKDIVQNTFGGEKFIYREDLYETQEAMPSVRWFSDLGSGEGLVITRYNTVFYGTFEEGKPNGEVLAVQTIRLDGHPRYTYADGLWKDGMMEGEGETGYCYYEGQPDGSYRSVKKTGTYVSNFQDGSMIYRTDNGAGRVLTWKMETDHGVTVLDGRWQPYGLEGGHILMSEEDDTRGYVLSKEKEDSVMWNNLILWDE